jgi:hypothetical protein
MHLQQHMAEIAGDRAAEPGAGLSRQNKIFAGMSDTDEGPTLNFSLLQIAPTHGVQARPNL